MAPTTLTCWNCAGSLATVAMPITRHRSCPHCHAELHCCRACRFYAPEHRHKCEHDRADPPTNKEGAYFCNFFATARTPRSASEVANTATKAATSLAALFGEDADGSAAANTERSTAESDARSKLDELFGGNQD